MTGLPAWGSGQPGQVGNQAALTVDSVPGVRLVNLFQYSVGHLPRAHNPSSTMHATARASDSAFQKASGFRSVWANNIPRLKKAMEGLFSRLGFECLDGALSVWRRRL